MIELKVTVDAPELSVAINHLADAIESKGTDAPAAPVKTPAARKPLPRLPRTHLRFLLLPILNPLDPRCPLNSLPRLLSLYSARSCPGAAGHPRHSCGRAYDAAACCNCRSRDDPACRSRDPAVYPPARCADTVSAGHHL